MLRTICFLTLIFTCISSAFASVRIKDVVSIEGIRENLLMGYGLVVGLNGSGDNLTNSAFTQKGLIDFLERMGINSRGANIKTKNLAAVIVTGSLPPFSRHGNKIDISVSTLGDAKSLQGGTLLATPMLGADGEVYAVAQGQVSIGGISVSGKSGTSVNKGVSTNGFLPNGAIIEKEIDFDLRDLNKIKLSLRNPDISTAIQIASNINQHMGGQIASAIDPGTVELSIPKVYKKEIVTLLAEIEQIEVDPDQPAKIVIDEASGTIVMGENVRISPVAVAQGNLTVTVTEETQVSQPQGARSGGGTAVTHKTTVSLDSDQGKIIQMIDKGSSLKELIDGLNALGIGPRDLITILQNIKAAGALQANIETR